MVNVTKDEICHIVFKLQEIEENLSLALKHCQRCVTVREAIEGLKRLKEQVDEIKKDSENIDGDIRVEV